MAQRVLQAVTTSLPEVLQQIWSSRGSSSLLRDPASTAPACGDGPQSFLGDNVMSSPFEGAQATLANGVIEIAALTALIGSSTAESLVLGSRGAAGVVWASMSVFGIYAVVKGCVGAVTPNWLRETLGVRSGAVDSSLGSSFDLAMKKIQTRSKLGTAVAIQCDIKKEGVGREQSTEDFLKGTRRDVYVLDRLTATCVRIVQADPKAPASGIYVYAQDPYDAERHAQSVKHDLIAVAASSVKLVEVYTMWRLGAPLVAWLAVVSWLLFSTCSLALMALGLSREHLGDFHGGARSDVLVGALPTALTAGGERRVLLSLPKNARHHAAWTIVWVLAAAASTAEVFAYYMLLGGLAPQIFYSWCGFQLAWLVARMAFFHLSHKHEELAIHPVLVPREWAALGGALRARVRNLAAALSSYLILIHPRKPYCYEEDAVAPPEMGVVVDEFALPKGARLGSKVKIHVESVVGDTLLGAAAWTAGAPKHLSGQALYDSCVVQLRAGPGEGSSDAGAEKMVSVPAARVLTGVRPPAREDEEAAPEPLFPPRGGTNTGVDIVWWYWIPCEDGTWLQLHTDEKLRMLGEREGEVLTDEMLAAKLVGGDLFVSLKDVKEVREIVNTSREVCSVFIGFLE